MHLFSQFDFLGGLDTRLDSSKLGDNKYPLLFNGRVMRNTVRPIKKHLLLDAPAGEKQGLYPIGKLLVLFVNGMAYWRDTTSSIPSWTPIWDDTKKLNTTGRIYAEAIPVSYYQGTIAYDGSSPDLGNVRKINFSGTAAPTAGQLFVTDGTHQPRVINPDGSWRVTQTYSEWSTSSPEYVPICVQPRRSGQKLYLIDPTGQNKIYHSVSGRFLDFVINRSDTGDKNGDAETTFKSVDFNPTTAILPLSDGAVFIGTLYASYTVIPDYTDTFFGEPLLPDSTIFPTGPVNDRSFANINLNGAYDVAFITQTGIQSFNVTRQTQRESNNSPLGAPIASLLNGTQSLTAACNFDIYSLFSVDTIYGKCVLVYDNNLEKFVSIDTDFGAVTDFAVVKTAGSQRLFFTNSVNEVYEAYASDTYAICRVHIGDYTYVTQEGQIAGMQHKVASVRVQFGEIKEPVEIQIGLYADKKLVGKAIRTLTTDSVPERAPQPLPYPSADQCEPISAKFPKAPFCWKSGVFVEWQGNAQLFSASFYGQTLTEENVQALTPYDSRDKVIAVVADTRMYPEVAATVNWTLLTGLVPGAWYSVVGEIHTGDTTYTNEVFIMPGTEANLKGSLRKLAALKDTYDAIFNLGPALIVGCGDHAYDNGDATSCQHIANLFKYSSLIWAAGNVDLDTDAGKYFWAIKNQTRYFKYSVDDRLDFFVLNSGYNSLDTVVEPDGVTASSRQAQWLRLALGDSTALHKIVVLHHPPYTEDALYYPGKLDLRWPFAAWGASMVLSGHAHCYQRFDIDGIPYVTVPTASGDVKGFKLDANSSIYRTAVTGYLKISMDKYNLNCELIDTASNEVRDVFGIYG